MYTHDHLRNLLTVHGQLKQLLQEVDPASGISIQVQRGPFRREEDDERPAPTVIPLEIGGANIQNIVLCLIAAAEESIKLNARLFEKNLQEARKVLDSLPQWARNSSAS